MGVSNAGWKGFHHNKFLKFNCISLTVFISINRIIRKH